MCTVGPAEGIAGLLCQFGVDGSQISRGENDVRVEYNYIVTRRPFNAIVAALPRAAVLFHEILQADSVAVFFANLLAGLL